MVIKAIQRRSAEQLVADALREQITSGDLLPGSRLTEISLSQGYGVSRGTLRIVLHQLAKEGLVVLAPYVGWSVATLAPQDLWELYTLRANFESMAARLVCKDLNALRRQELSDAYERLVDACHQAGYSRIAERDFELHKKIVALSGHQMLMDHYRLVEQKIRTFVATTYHFVLDTSSVIEHHAPIFEAIMRADSDQACGLLEEHASSEGRKLHDFLISQTQAHQ